MDTVKVENGERKIPSFTVREKELSVSPSAKVYIRGSASMR